jgi:hypothetical protein
MKNYTPLPDTAARSARTAALWHRLGRPLATAAIAIAAVLAIMHGESWALRHEAPLLLNDILSASANAGCQPDDGAAGSALPIAILH